MPPTVIMPLPDPIPLPWGWFQLLLLATFFLHLLVMNAMLGSGLIAFFRTLKSNQATDSVGYALAGKLPFTIAFAVNLGVPPLLFLQVLYGHLFYTSSILMASYWLLVIPFLILAYYGAYVYYLKFEALGRKRPLFIGLSVLLLLGIAFLFTNNMTLMLMPGKWTAYFSQPNGRLLNLDEPTLWPRYLHFVNGSLAVGGLFQALLAGRRKPQDERAIEDRRNGLRWFTAATAFQVLLGFWFLFSLPRAVSSFFLGGDGWGTGLLILALALAAAALFAGYKAKLKPAVGFTAGTILLMVLVRDLARQAYLSPYFHPSSLPVIPQTSPLVFFLVTLVIGLAVVVYMLKLAAQSTRRV
jgi:hypothetical protein